MTRIQERTFIMYKNIKDCLTTNSSIVSSLPQYSVYYELFEASLNQIAIVQAVQLQNNTKIETQNKTKLRDLCTNSIEKLIIAINAYSLITKNNILQQRLPTFITKYKQVTDIIFVAQSNNLYNISFPYAAALENYGIDTNFFTNFRNNIDAYTEIMVTPRQKAIQNAATTAKLAHLFTKIKVEFAHISSLVALKKFTEPLFYNNFIISSKILNNGHVPYALRIALKADSITNLRGFIFNFIRQSDGKVFEYKTNANGRIVRLEFKADVYKLSIKKTGYTKKSATITVEDGITYKLNVRANINDKTFEIQ